MRLHHWFFDGKSHAFFSFEEVEFIPIAGQSWKKFVRSVGADRNIIIESYRPHTLQLEIVSSANNERIVSPKLSTVELPRHILHPHIEDKWHAEHHTIDNNINLRVSNGSEQDVVHVDDFVCILLQDGRFCGITVNAPLKRCEDVYREMLRKTQ